MSFNDTQYNRFYYSNICHVCKEFNQNLKRCSQCKSIAYCSKDHQKQDWKLHKDLCRVINKVSNTALKHIPIDNFEEFKRYNVFKGAAWQNELNRSLFRFECQMWMFPRVCAICFSTNVIIDCSNCLNVFYCSELHKQVHEKIHYKLCDALRLGMEIDRYYFNEKFIPAIIDVHDFDPEIDTLPNTLKDLIIMYEKMSAPNRNNSDEFIQFIVKSDIIAPAAIILYAMEKSGLLNSRILSKSQLTLHIVGAEVTEISWIWKLIAEFHFHWIKNLKSLEFHLIGPELNQEGMTEISAKALCNNCKAKQASTKIMSHWKLYHDVVHSLVKPDIVVAFNSGLHTIDDNSWCESIDYLTMYPEAPFVLTAYTEDEIISDVRRVHSMSKHRIEVILEPQKNPFCNMTPIRDWETFNSPVFYVNGYIAIMKAAQEEGNCKDEM